MTEGIVRFLMKLKNGVLLLILNTFLNSYRSLLITVQILGYKEVTLNSQNLQVEKNVKK